MFSEFTFKQFKSFKESVLPVSPLTLIIGANASGKSNALEGIQFLSRLTTMTLKDNILGVRGQFAGIRGGSEKITFSGGDWFELGFKFKTAELTGNHSIRVNIKPSIKRSREELITTTINETPVVLIADGEKIRFCDTNIPDGDLEESILFGINLDEKLNQKGSFDDLLRGIFIYNPLPEYMKDYVLVSDNKLKPNAENLSAVIAELIKKDEVKSILLELLQDLPEQNIEKIDVARISQPDSDVDLVTLLVEEELGKRKMFFTAKHLSDGTLRFLAMITAVLSEPEGATITIEDIDAGIHPARLKKLLTFISQTVRKKNMSLIATSHNPALLNSLSREDISGVVVCYRDTEEGDSKFIRLIDLPSYPELIMSGRLGDLLTQRLIEKAAHETEEDREKEFEQKLKWIEEELACSLRILSIDKHLQGYRHEEPEIGNKKH